MLILLIRICDLQSSFRRFGSQENERERVCNNLYLIFDLILMHSRASEAANLGPNITEVNVSPVSNGTAYPSIDSQTPQEVAEQKSGNWWPFGQSKA